MGKDDSSGMVAQTSTIKLAMTVTQEWWGRFPPSLVAILILYSKNVLGP